VLSPETSYAGPDGKPIDPLGQALYINGKETWSVVWDGKPAELELQYTCPDHIGHTLKLTVPAAGAVQPKDQNPPAAPQASFPQPSAEKKAPDTSLKDLIKIILVGTGVISIGTGAIVLGRKLITGRSTPKGDLDRDISVTKRQASSREISKQTTQKEKMNSQTRSELQQRVEQLDAKWHEIRREIDQRERQLLNLKRKNTSNRFKVMIKKAIEVKETISGPVGKFVGEGFKGVTGVDIDKMLYDIDNKKDVDILVQGKQCQAALTNYLQTLKQELLKIGREHTQLLHQLNDLDAQQ
jgi:hypothetical protein